MIPQQCIRFQTKRRGGSHSASRGKCAYKSKMCVNRVREWNRCSLQLGGEKRTEQLLTDSLIQLFMELEAPFLYRTARGLSMMISQGRVEMCFNSGFRNTVALCELAHTPILEQRISPKANLQLPSGGLIPPHAPRFHKWTRQFARLARPSNIQGVIYKIRTYKLRIRSARQTASPADWSSDAYSFRSSALRWSCCFRWRWRNSGR